MRVQVSFPLLELMCDGRQRATLLESWRTPGSQAKLLPLCSAGTGESKWEL